MAPAEGSGRGGATDALGKSFSREGAGYGISRGGGRVLSQMGVQRGRKSDATGSEATAGGARSCVLVPARWALSRGCAH